MIVVAVLGIPVFALWLHDRHVDRRESRDHQH